jgi:hypothetical protein
MGVIERLKEHFANPGATFLAFLPGVVILAGQEHTIDHRNRPLSSAAGPC